MEMQTLMCFACNYLGVRIQGEQLQSRLAPHPRLDISGALRRRNKFNKSVNTTKPFVKHCKCYLRDFPSVLKWDNFFCHLVHLEMRLHSLQSDHAGQTG